MFYDLASKIVTFESVSMSKFKIESACQGVYEYIPVILGDDHFTLINMSVIVCSSISCIYLLWISNLKYLLAQK